MLAELNADVVLLQEADKRFGNRAGVLSAESLRDELGYHFVEFPSKADSHGWHGNAILYRASLTLIDSAALEIPCLEPRGAVRASFAASEGTLQVVGAHLALLTPIRRKQYRALIEHCECNDASSTVIGGDFNDRRSDEKLRSLLPTGYQVLSPGASFHTARPTWPLDRFFVAGSEVRANNTHVHSSSTARVASDHLPVCLDLELRGDTPKSGDS